MENCKLYTVTNISENNTLLMCHKTVSFELWTNLRCKNCYYSNRMAGDVISNSITDAPRPNLIYKTKYLNSPSNLKTGSDVICFRKTQKKKNPRKYVSKISFTSFWLIFIKNISIRPCPRLVILSEISPNLALNSRSTSR